MAVIGFSGSMWVVSPGLTGVTISVAGVKTAFPFVFPEAVAAKLSVPTKHIIPTKVMRLIIFFFFIFSPPLFITHKKVSFSILHISFSYSEQLTHPFHKG